MTQSASRDGREGRFIVLDGVDGAGKSTQVARLRDALIGRGHAVHVTREPSDWPIGQLIRRYLRGEIADGAPGWASMALLFAADRMQHVEHEVAPRLARGEVVISDRYDASSIAYQSALAPAHEGDAALRWIARINGQARRPDLTVLFDLSPEAAAERRSARGGARELYEHLELQRRIRSQYGKLAEVRPTDRMVTIDASRSVEEVHGDVLAAVVAALGASGG